jgi:hypothetical protein
LNYLSRRVRLARLELICRHPLADAIALRLSQPARVDSAHFFVGSTDAPNDST